MIGNLAGGILALDTGDLYHQARNLSRRIAAGHATGCNTAELRRAAHMARLAADRCTAIAGQLDRAATLEQRGDHDA